jgi:hypothetical protein
MDLEKAFELYTAASDNGAIAALHNLGTCFMDGTGVSRDIEKAKQFLTTSFEKGVSRSTYDLGILYLRHDIDAMMALHWFSLSLANGNMRSLDPMLGLCDKLTDSQFESRAKLKTEILVLGAEHGDAKHREKLVLDTSHALLRMAYQFLYGLFPVPLSELVYPQDPEIATRIFLRYAASCNASNTDYAIVPQTFQTTLAGLRTPIFNELSILRWDAAGGSWSWIPKALQTMIVDYIFDQDRFVQGTLGRYMVRSAVLDIA